MAKERVHEVILKVRFDGPVNKREAKALVRNNIHGTFYDWLEREDGKDVGEFKVVSVK